MAEARVVAVNIEEVAEYYAKNRERLLKIAGEVSQCILSQTRDALDVLLILALNVAAFVYGAADEQAEDLLLAFLAVTRAMLAAYRQGKWPHFAGEVEADG